MEEFNDINEAWKKINEDKFSSSNIKKEEIMKAISKESSLTIAELKKRLKYKMNWVIFFIIAFAGGMLWNLNHLPYLALCALGFVIYIFALSGIYHEYKAMDGYIDSSADTLSEMKNQRDVMKRALKSEERWGYIAFPIIITASLVLPKISRGASITDLLTDFNFMMIWIVALIVLTLGGMWVGKKLNKIGYGEQLDELEENIKKMEEL